MGYGVLRGPQQVSFHGFGRLEEVGLSDVIEDLSQKGKIAEAKCPAIEELLPKATEK